MRDADYLLIGIAAVALYYLWPGASAATATPGASYGGYFDPSAPGYNSYGNYVMTNTPGAMTLSPEGAAFIKQQEGLNLTPYWDMNGYSGGYGHHFQSGEAMPAMLTQAQADQYFSEDVAKCEAAVNSSVTVPLSQGQFDALCDFVYNEGVTAFETSTLLKLLNMGNYSGASAEFSRWDYAGGKVNKVLASRRTGEQNLFVYG